MQTGDQNCTEPSRTHRLAVLRQTHDEADSGVLNQQKQKEKAQGV
jgi:hypothetical protein